MIHYDDFVERQGICSLIQINGIMYESMFTLNIGENQGRKTNNYICQGFLKTSKKLERKFIYRIKD